MPQGVYKIAGHRIKINSIYKEIHLMCKKYKTNSLPEFNVNILPEDIDFERTKSKAEDKRKAIIFRNFSNEYLETLAVYRKIADELIAKDILLFHGSVIAVDGEGYLFTAKSGTGKSTHIRLWRELFGDRAVMVNDDKPLLKITENRVIAYGTPWDGKHHLSNNISVPLKGICILKRVADREGNSNTENYIEKIEKKQAYAMLVQQSYRPNDPSRARKVLRLIDKLAEEVLLYKLYCNIDPEAAMLAYEGMN